jgi:hypothetical protein
MMHWPVRQRLADRVNQRWGTQIRSGTVSGDSRRVLTAMRNRYFFPAVIGAILVVLAIMAVILLVLGDNEDQGEDTGPDPSPESAPLLVRQLDPA